MKAASAFILCMRSLRSDRTAWPLVPSRYSPHELTWVRMASNLRIFSSISMSVPILVSFHQSYDFVELADGVIEGRLNFSVH